MSYATRTELAALTGTSLDDAILSEILDQADREVNARLALAGISAPASDDTLKAASLNLSIAGVLTRTGLDGSHPSGITIGDISVSDNPDTAKVDLRTKANELIDSYIKTHGTYDRYRWTIRKI